MFIWHSSINKKTKQKQQKELRNKMNKNIMGEDGGGVVGCGAHLFPRIHQENIFRHRSACRTPAESRQEYLSSGEEHIDLRKAW